MPPLPTAVLGALEAAPNAEKANSLTLLEGSIQMVTGLISPDEIGFTLPVEASAREIYFAELSNETIAYSRYNGIKNLSVGRLGKVGDAIDEIDLFKQWGGGSVVDTIGNAGGRNPVGLMRTATQDTVDTGIFTCLPT